MGCDGDQGELLELLELFFVERGEVWVRCCTLAWERVIDERSDQKQQTPVVC